MSLKSMQRNLTKINYKNLDITKIQGQKFNLITCMEVLEHMEYPAEIIANPMNYWKKWNFSRVYYQQNNLIICFCNY